MAKKDDAYRWIKVGGLLSLIPLTLAAGPLAGYIAGDYLAKRFSLPEYTTVVFIGIGIAASMLETFRIIKAALINVKK